MSKSGAGTPDCSGSDYGCNGLELLCGCRVRVFPLPPGPAAHKRDQLAGSWRAKRVGAHDRAQASHVAQFSSSLLKMSAAAARPEVRPCPSLFLPLPLPLSLPLPLPLPPSPLSLSPPDPSSLCSPFALLALSPGLLTAPRTRVKLTRHALVCARTHARTYSWPV